MIDKKGYEEWREIFSQEKKGNTPEDVMYNPVPKISISPYIDQKKRNNPAIHRIQSAISHSILLDPSSAEWMTNIASIQESFDIKYIYIEKDATLNESIDFSPSFSKDKLKIFDPTTENPSLILDFGNVDILPLTKQSFESVQSKVKDIYIIPGHDFLWNTALLRGIRKYLRMQIDHPSFTDLFSILIPLQQCQHGIDESQLIALSNQLLAMIIGGLNHCIWDVRNMTAWQKANFTHLLSVPEILVREGRILLNEDPIAGSDFFEELSDKVVNYLVE